MNVSDYIAAIRYQCTGPSVTTWGPCANDCGDGARGSRTCRHCLGQALAELIDPALAARYVLAAQEFGLATWAVEEAAGG